jgi:2-polyprenyl-3-methyl-5-hydroxy-6-metoxy-1,4-benzoquinol methylase
MTMDNQRLGETRQYWDKEAATFDNEPDHGLGDHVVLSAWRELLEISLPSAPSSILDMGCGTGSLSVVMAALGHEVTGLDLSPAMIARAEAKAETVGCSITFKIMDASDPQISQQRFDALVCRHLLWALPDRILALQRWSSLLSPGGRLVLIEGNWQSGGGLRPQQIVEALPSNFSSVIVRDLSAHPNLWGVEVTDERYIVIADLPLA